MQNPLIKKLFSLLALLFALWLGLRYALPVALPFALGLALALGAEPLVGLCEKKLHLPRALGAGLAVTAVLGMVLTLLTLLISALVRQLGQLTQVLPDLEQTARQGVTALEDLLLGLASRAPEGMRNLLTRWVLGLFHNDRVLGETALAHLPGIATSILGHIPGGALSLGTGIISSYMFSARLPRIKAFFRDRPRPRWVQQVLPTLGRLRACLGSWLTAQAKLSGVSFCVLCLGLLLLGIPYAPVWAAVIALVDAMPILGSGTVLLPWALVCLVQGNSPRALGLAALYAAGAVLRSVLEPKLLGRQLGLDPLVTLGALYVGFQFWGFWGMLLAPLVAVLATQLTKPEETPPPQG